MTVETSLPLGARGTAISSNGSKRFIDRVQGKTPFSYGAVGDYNPTTNTGTDDTVAIQAWLDGLGSDEMGYFPPFHYFKCTGPLATQARVHLEGAGRYSGLFFVMSDTSKHGLNLGGIGAASSAVATLKNFAIYSRTSPDNATTDTGQGAITAYSLNMSDIDLWIDGRWKYMLHVVPTASYSGFGDITHGGGIETSKIRLKRPHNPVVPGSTYVPFAPYHGVYNKGWSNGVRYDLDLQVVYGYGVYLEGVYSSANGGSSIVGTLQGVSQGDLLEAVKISYCNNFSINALYTEAGGAPIPIVIANGSKVSLNEPLGAVRLTTCTNTRVINPGGVVTIDSDCVATIVDSGGADNPPLINASPSTITRGRRAYSTITSTRFPVANADVSPANVALNGDFERWLAGVTTNNIWGTRPGTDGHYYTGTLCGDGQADTTRTTYARYCALIEDRDSWGSSMARTLWAANELTGLVGQTIWVAFKYKISAGIPYVQGCASNGSIANQINLATADTVWSVENGFSQFGYCFVIDSAIVTNGFDLRIHVPDTAGAVETKVYVSELMAGIGNSPPPAYQPVLRAAKQSHVTLQNGRLIVAVSAAPGSGGDPVHGQSWQVGDEIVFTAPTSGGYRGSVCTVAGSPGTWKSWGVIA